MVKFFTLTNALIENNEKDMIQIETLDVSILGKEKTIAAYLLKQGDKSVLIDCGPESSFVNLEKQLNNLGLKVSDISDLLLTHIHLDHGGGAWRFAEAGTKIHVHPFGTRHLVDPTKFLASAEKVYKGKMKQLWGDMNPIDPNKISSKTDNEILKIGDLNIECLFTLGHAKHHACWLIDGNLFTGDTAGCRASKGPVVAPTPPPDLDFEEWEKSLKIIESQDVKKLYLTHYGDFDDVQKHVDDLRKFLSFSQDLGRKMIARGITFDNIGDNILKEMEESYLKFSPLKDMYDSYQVMTATWMNAQGLILASEKESEKYKKNLG